MATLGWLVWWALVLGASWQARKAWGSAFAVGSVAGLWLLSTLPLGTLISVGVAIAIGARAEAAQTHAMMRLRA